MAIAVHVINTPNTNVREAYEAAWRRLDEQQARHPRGRQSHTAWLVADVLHVLDVWDSEADLNAFMGTTLAPLLQEFGMEVAGQPEVGELVQVAQPD